MTLVSFTVPGLPQGKGRARFGNGRAYTPAKTVAYEGLIALAGQQAMDGRALLEGPLSLVVFAYFPMPKVWGKRRREQAANGADWYAQRPDGDNILKAVSDGLNGVVYKDDAQIALATISKKYSQLPRVEVEIRSFEGETE